MKKVIVIGFDGLEPQIVEAMLNMGELPSLAKLKQQGGYSYVSTTYPAQTPVAWSTFATGTNPGGHGIFDFIRRDPKTYLPDLSLNRYEQKNRFLPPKAVNLRRGTPLWELLSKAGIPSIILRCPCTFPPDNIRGRMLSGMGVPDLRGGLGTPTFYSSAESVKEGESENIVRLRVDKKDKIATHLIGPRNPKTKSDFRFEMTLDLDSMGKMITLHSEGQPKILEIREGQWSGWLRIKFKVGPLQSVHGMVRFYLVRLEPEFELYASPINFDLEAPMFPICSPPEYTKEMCKNLGIFYTTGMVEDHTGLNNGRFSESAYLEQCNIVMREREKMALYELDRFEEGFFFCLFDTPDRLQHMFWRFREREHPANHGKTNSEELTRIIEDHYRACDAVVEKVLRYVDDQTLFIVLSDHGMKSFQRGFHLNTWLFNNHYLALKNKIQPGEEAGDFFRSVDWSHTKAYALGLGGIYLNLKGREEEGIVRAEEANDIEAAIIKGLTRLHDPDQRKVAIRSVLTRDQVYTGIYAHESPDLIVNFADGYRVSWNTALGGIPAGLFEDNVKKWSGDHSIDPSLVPGVLFMNRKFSQEKANLLDLAPTILAVLGIPKGPSMEGNSLLI